MKKLVLTLIAALGFCGLVSAQSYESHWPDFYGPDYDSQTPFVAAIQIDGQTITAEYEGWDALEIAFFVGDECRGSGSTFPLAVPLTYYLYNGYVEEYGDPFPVIDGAALYFNASSSGEEVTVKVYDHLREIEYTDCVVTLEGEPYVILTGADNDQGWYDPENPIMLSFTSPTPAGEPTVIAGGYWNAETTWQSGEVPENVDVVINGTVTIPNGFVAHANDITISEGGSLVIEDGGQLYHTGDVGLTMLMDVTGYDNSKDGNKSGYRLIAVPVYTDEADLSMPVDGTNLNTGTFDLYMFDQNQDLEWINYEPNGFDLLHVGVGYLYANAANISQDSANAVHFVGTTLPTSGDIAVDVAYTDGAELAGWNLIGNPFTCKATLDMDYYVLNPEGSEVLPDVQNSAILPLQGIFVKTDAEGQCLFTPYDPSASGGKGILTLNVNQNRGLVDRAIITFGEGGSLEKFQLNPNHTKVYIPVEGTDYAIVSAGNEGEMPVNFKAEKNGTYTINFASENTELRYLHLIDNMTGADVDLLANQSYSFDATTTDYASRFRLVFATGHACDDSNFGYISDGNIIIAGNTSATVQVIDALGRILVSENGVSSVSTTGMVPGVYVLRLINGNDVKTQKIVVR